MHKVLAGAVPKELNYPVIWIHVNKLEQDFVFY